MDREIRQKEEGIATSGPVAVRAGMPERTGQVNAVGTAP